MGSADPRPACTPEASRLAAIRLLGVDIDGVLTDGRLWYGVEGEQLKAFHVHDGLGLKLVQAAGIEVAIISARESVMVNRRLDDLGIPLRLQGSADKGAALRGLRAERGLTTDAVAFIGDDLPDLAAFAEAGLKIAVANAQAPVRTAADWVTALDGGQGAVREVCNALLAARIAAAATTAAIDGRQA